MIFLIPYQGNKALIGTTDIMVDQIADSITISDDEVVYLLEVVNRYFKQKIHAKDIVDKYSGIRPLYDDGTVNPSGITRDYTFDIKSDNGATFISIFGGKITTYRKLAEQLLDKLTPIHTDMGKSWTVQSALPGGDIADRDFTSFLNQFNIEYPWMPRRLTKHYAKLYGTRVRLSLDKITSVDGLGKHFGGRLYEAEARYLHKHEWAISAEDVLTRRTKHALHLTSDQCALFADWWQRVF